MKKTYAAIAIFTLMTFGASLVPAQCFRNSGACPGQRQGIGQKQGKCKGKKMASQDGSGPRQNTATPRRPGAGQRRGWR